MAIEPQQRSELGCELVTDVAHRFGEVRLKIIGASMIPSLWPGDFIIVCRRDMAALRVGHVIVYRRNGVLVTHRIRHMSGDLLTTRGDSMRRNDSPIKYAEIIGQVVCIDRNGHCLHLTQSWWQRAVSSAIRHSDLCLHITLSGGLRWRSFHGRGSHNGRRTAEHH